MIKCRSCRDWAEVSIHKAAKEAFTLADEWDCLAREIEQMEQTRKFAETGEKAASKIHVD